MGVETIARYAGDFRVELVHGPTGERVVTDLPADNGGKGRGFSPTDLMAASLASCILTIMAKAVEADGTDLKGASIKVVKHMKDKPRMIGSFALKLELPAGLSEKSRTKLLACVAACPVHRSLHPDIKVELETQP
ncbi:MAG: OsmC family protein [Elusimicrobia bacterium]|nr:OsmC family protein [Elusimicrobiota bacterium]